MAHILTPLSRASEGWAQPLANSQYTVGNTQSSGRGLGGHGSVRVWGCAGMCVHVCTRVCGRELPSAGQPAGQVGCIYYGLRPLPTLWRPHPLLVAALPRVEDSQALALASCFMPAPSSLTQQVLSK